MNGIYDDSVITGIDGDLAIGSGSRRNSFGLQAVYAVYWRNHGSHELEVANYQVTLRGVSKSWIAGDLLGSDSDNATIWNVNSNFRLDLQQFLPSNYSSSVAQSVFADNQRNVTVAGFAFNSTAQRSEAVLWRNSVPEPAPALVFAAGLPFLRRRHRRSVH